MTTPSLFYRRETEAQLVNGASFPPWLVLLQVHILTHNCTGVKGRPLNLMDLTLSPEDQQSPSME